MKFYLIILISAISLFSSLNPANAMEKDAPEICPVCSHPKSFFEIKAENY